MFRPKLLFTSLAALALGACSPQDPQAVTSAAIAKQVILPTYSRWVEADRQLAVSALAYCQGKESLDTARADFLHAQKAWAELQPLLIGPLAEGNRSWQVQFWPDKKNLVGRQVEQLVSTQPQIDAATLAKSSVVVQGLSAYDAEVITATRPMADYFDALIAAGAEAKAAANWLMGEVSKLLNACSLDIRSCPVPPANLAEMIALIEKGTISGKIAKTVFEAMWNEGKTAPVIVKEQGLVQMSDEGELGSIVEAVYEIENES